MTPLWWCWHCMKEVPYEDIRLIEDSGGCTGYCKLHPFRGDVADTPKADS